MPCSPIGQFYLRRYVLRKDRQRRRNQLAHWTIPETKSFTFIGYLWSYVLAREFHIRIKKKNLPVEQNQRKKKKRKKVASREKSPAIPLIYLFDGRNYVHRPLSFSIYVYRFSLHFWEKRRIFFFRN